MPSASLLLANTVTHMMSVYIPFLLIGNAIIGLLEGLVLAKLFKANRKRAFGLMIGANYVSAFAGVVLYGDASKTGLIQARWPLNIENYENWIVMAVAVAFIVTLILEWPFCHASFDKDRRKLRRTIPACLLVQSLSYLCCLAPFSLMHWKIDLGEHVTIDESLSFIPDNLPFWVYYIDPIDGDIHRMRPNGSNNENFMQGDYGDGDQLYVYRDDEHDLPDVAPTIDLYVTGRTPKGRMLVESFAKRESAFQREYEDINHYLALPYFTGYYAADLRDIKNGNWQIQPMYFSGIRFKRFGDDLDEDTRIVVEWFHLRWSTHFGTWQGHNPTILPGEIVIFEFGGQICALDLNTRKLGLICMGYGPVVVRDEGELSSDSEHAENAADQVHRAEDTEAAPGEDED